MTKPNYTHLEVIVDKSGSMSPTAKDTIGSINAFVTKQKEVTGTASYRLTQFNHTVNHGEYHNSLNDVQPLTPETYSPSGNTSLLDAIGQSITTLGSKLASLAETERPSKVIVVIMTDGEENSSKHWNRSTVSEMISHQKNTYNWEFLFLGANQDAIQVGTSLGVAKGATLNYAQTGSGLRGMGQAVNRVIANSRAYGASVNTTTDLFTPDEIKSSVAPDNK